MPTKTEGSPNAPEAASARQVVTCTRKIQFCAGHRVMGHENKCVHLHGHNYEVHITAEAQSLDKVGRVVDFSVLKGEIGSWIEQQWDHGFLLWEKDTKAIETLKGFLDGGQKLFIFPDNPTAENLASYILRLGNDVMASKRIRIIKVVVWETPNCYAEASLADTKWT